jgi:predicted O-methyltransferase YrrM
MKPSQFLAAARVSLRNVVLGSNAMSLKLMRHPGRVVGYASESLFLYRAYSGERPLPMKNVFDLFPEAERVDIRLGYLQPTTIYGEPWMHQISSYTADIVSLCTLASILKPKTVFEIGTLHGYTAYHFAMNSPDDCTVYSLDLPKEAPVAPSLRTTVVDDAHIGMKYVEYCFSGKEEEKKIKLLFGDSARYDYAPFADKVDLFFIDGAHSYEYVRSDTLNALQCVRPGGVIAWHDFGRVGVNGVSRWLGEMRAKGAPVFSIPGGSLAFMRMPETKLTLQ